MRWFKKSETDLPSDPTAPEHRFERRDTLFNTAEQAFFDVLEKNLAPPYRVLGKIAPTGLMDTKTDTSDARLRALMQEMSTHCLDFVICEGDDFKIRGVVLLEDMPADQAGRRLFDSFIDRMMAAVGIPVVHIPAKASYSVQEIKVEISRSLFVKWRITTGGNDKQTDGDNSLQPTRQPRPGSGGQNAFGNCPVCGSAYVKRQAKSGKYAGKFFLACAHYPQCKNLRLLKNPSPCPRSSRQE